MTDLERRALAIWQAREMGFPRFVRRMKPDDWDRMSGAWDRVLRQAAGFAGGEQGRRPSSAGVRPSPIPQPERET